MRKTIFTTTVSLLFPLTLLAADKQETVAPTINTGVWHAITNASLIVQITLLILIAMSVVTWAVIVSKRKLILTVKKNNELFLAEFWKANALDEIYQKLGDLPDSPLVHVFRSAYLELTKIADSELASNKEDNTTFRSGLDNLERALRRAMDTEIAKIESKLSFLATTGSTGPFIGLFGTVWGIMNAFQKIALMQNASLAVVAPGISEALVATAIGLGAAIPASVGYNHFVSQIGKLELEINNFSSDFLNIAKRNFFKGE